MKVGKLGSPSPKDVTIQVVTVITGRGKSPNVWETTCLLFFASNQRRNRFCSCFGCELRTFEFFPGGLTGHAGRMVSNEGNIWPNTKVVSVETRNTVVCNWSFSISMTEPSPSGFMVVPTAIWWFKITSVETVVLSQRSRCDEKRLTTCEVNLAPKFNSSNPTKLCRKMKDEAYLLELETGKSRIWACLQY